AGLVPRGRRAELARGSADRGHSPRKFDVPRGGLVSPSRVRAEPEVHPLVNSPAVQLPAGDSAGEIGSDLQISDDSLTPGFRDSHHKLCGVFAYTVACPGRPPPAEHVPFGEGTGEIAASTD